VLRPKRTVIDISDKKFDEIPKEIFVFEELEELNIEKNMIQEIPDEISSFKKLRFGICFTLKPFSAVVVAKLHC